MSGNPVPDGPDFLVVVFVGLDRRRRAIEYGDRVAPVIGICWRDQSPREIAEHHRKMTALAGDIGRGRTARMPSLPRPQG
jgi:hypothetical protein